ncbi:uncharacterized protein BP5553_07141 [Venustampulla echinocandica]|uniref:DUF6546 domain-containing protein n=1 Tax=Venustampulla echinocandica TaxID=2656787 RepID=A0A370TIP1_9HELO|nr:uncharacterized protein BP5553_07141 [Venustampulla echinocandica]RDL35210.1 hypothetical protein BP5553_07141 [Venustampulla echinocandica]
MGLACIRTRLQHRKARNETYQWDRLPFEVRLLILEALIQHQRCSSKSKPAVAKPDNTLATTLDGGPAGYASVCREWRAVFEKNIFHRLVLHQQDLEEFGNLVRFQKELVKHIWLRIELDLYTCLTCREGENKLMKRKNNDTIKQAIYKLFSILSSWEEHHSRNNRGLTLEISIHSPSDSQHHFQDHRIHAVDDCVEPTQDFGGTVIYDYIHGWDNRRRVHSLRLSSIFSLFGHPVDVRFRQKFPSVSVVKHLLIRRQTRRKLWPTTLQQILKRLPKLESLYYEPWRQLSRSLRETYDEGYTTTFSNVVPNTLTNLILFEDFNEDFIFANMKERGHNGERERICCPALGAVLAQRSLSHENLSASFLIDAKDFLKACPPGGIWPKLTSLALTSPLLSSNSSLEDINNLVLAAASAAYKMPKLQTMELWNGGKRHAFLFRYHTTDNHTTISWHGTWNLNLKPHVIEAWREVALKYAAQELRIEKGKILDCNIINSHGAAIHQLKLKIQVVHPVSLSQIRGEAENYFPR